MCAMGAGRNRARLCAENDAGLSGEFKNLCWRCSYFASDCATTPLNHFSFNLRTTFSHTKLESKKKHILNSKAVVVLCVTGGLRRGRIDGGGSFRRSESEGMEMTDGVMSRLPVLSDAGGRYRKENRWRSESVMRGGADPV
ncbi:unnamed protein product [Vicia faba]|uniref:Uncharacterized protein n=1 Tax=Vicia faba TaxID=3906 RepID=A0AAV1B0C2_VICFA|nr:unnamed protein product [Vicia faba]